MIATESETETPNGKVLAQPKALMIYDGLCGFCNWNVRWVLKRDRADRFRFAPQQSPLAEAALARHGVDRDKMLSDNSVYLLLNYDPDGDSDIEGSTERLLRGSDVAVNILLLLGGGWPLAAGLFGAIPKFLRDGVYGFVARNRFRIAGRYESCPLPSPAERAKFVG